MTSKKPSGAEYRKRRKIAEEERRKSANNMNSWLISHRQTTSQTDHLRRFTVEDIKTEQSSGFPESNVTTANKSPKPNFSTTRKQIKEEDGKSFELLESGADIGEDHKNDKPELNLKEFDEAQTSNSIFVINYNDTPSWPPITDKIRIILITHRPEQGKDFDFMESTSQDGRKFSAAWFSKKLPNGEVVDRNWLIYSQKSKSLFCFPCILFSNNGLKLCSSLCNRLKGFSDWKHLGRLVDHENTADHREKFLKWKILEKKIKNGALTDDALERIFLSKKQK